MKVRSVLQVGAAVALATSGAVVAIGSGTASAASVTREFEFTGDVQPFDVPADVCQVTVDAFGAGGGDSDAQSGGAGGRATATIATIPGETLSVRVGGAGEHADDDDGGAGGSTAAVTVAAATTPVAAAAAVPPTCVAGRTFS